MKKIIIIAAVTALIISAATFYLNKILIPKKLKILFEQTLQKQTGKQVTLKSLEFSIFRGLILKDLVIFDNQGVILSSRQASFRFFVWPILKKQIIIPSIRFVSPYIFIERKADGHFNLEELFIPNQTTAGQSGFHLAVFRLVVANGKLSFEDNTLPQKAKKEFKNIQLNVALGLPVKFKFNFTGQLSAAVPVEISAAGEYKIMSRELSGAVNFRGLSLQEITDYYTDYKGLASGLADLQAQFKLKNDLLQIALAASGRDLLFKQGTLSAQLDSVLESQVAYNLANKKLEFHGACDIKQADISGIEFLNQIENLHGKLIFNHHSLVAQSLQADFLGLPFEINLGIKDFSTKVLHIGTSFDLSILPPAAKDKLNIPWLNSASGQAGLTLDIYPSGQQAWSARGELKISDADLKLDNLNDPLEDVSASVTFSQQGLSWKEAQFKYQGVDYRSDGTLVDFNQPHVNLNLESKMISCLADFDLLGQKIKLNRARGRYSDSQFELSGDIDRSDPAQPQVDLTGKLMLELQDLSRILTKRFAAAAGWGVSGKLDTDFILSGQLTDFKNCYLKMSATAAGISLSGFKATDFALSFLQEAGVAKVPAAYFTFYDGVVQGAGAINLDTADLIYRLELHASGVNLAKLKDDTASRQKDIAGIFSGAIRLNGSGGDWGKLEGAGNLEVNRGRLGELNLLQGLGKLLLAKDLGKIEFNACSCSFLVKDRSVYTDKFRLHSQIVNLSGPVKVGFDQSLEGALDVEVLNEMVPLEGTFRDVTTAIIGKGGRFGVIRLGGTMQDPKYSFKTAVGNIIQGITSMILKK